MPTPAELEFKKELILDSETLFANRIGSAVFEQPRVSMWMILLPILLVHFIYRMRKYKEGRQKFNKDFMATRRKAMDVAVQAAKTGAAPNVEPIVRQAVLADALKDSFESWVLTLVEYYMDLLAAEGDDLESLVRSAYGNSSNCLLALNRLGAAERRFYTAIRPQMEEMEGAERIIVLIQERSHQLRREFAEKIFG